LKASSPTVHAQDRTACPIIAFYPYYYRRPGHSVSVVGGLVRAELSAEVLFLRKQLAFYQEHQVQPRKLTDAARFSLMLWSHLFDWRTALMIVKPETLIGCIAKGLSCFGGGSHGWEDRGFRKIFAS
jgi:hypothetical protein